MEDIPRRRSQLHHELGRGRQGEWQSDVEKILCAFFACCLSIARPSFKPTITEKILLNIHLPEITNKIFIQLMIVQSSFIHFSLLCSPFTTVTAVRKWLNTPRNIFPNTFSKRNSPVPKQTSQKSWRTLSSRSTSISNRPRSYTNLGEVYGLR